MKNIILLIIGTTLLTSCVARFSSDVYSPRQVGEVSMTYPGCVVSMRQVCIQNRSDGAGVVAGGIAGGVIGSAVGGGYFAPTALGAIAGATMGSLIENDARHGWGLEYVVQLDNGQLMTIVQGHDRFFERGQPVYVLVSPSGRSRIIPQ